MKYEYSCRVVRVIDGDALELDVDLGCDIRIGMTVRLYGVDTPERFTPEGKAATAFVERWVKSNGPNFTLHTIKDRKGKYGRYLGTLKRSPLGPSLADELIAAGHEKAVTPDGSVSRSNKDAPA